MKATAGFETAGLSKPRSRMLGENAADFLSRTSGFDPEALMAHRLVLALAKLYSKAVVQYPSRRYVENVRRFYAPVREIAQTLELALPQCPRRNGDVPGFLADVDARATHYLRRRGEGAPTTLTVPQRHTRGWRDVAEDRIIDGIQARLAEAGPAIALAFYHGSYATRDFVRGGSDIDIVVFLSEQMFASEDGFWATVRALSAVNGRIREIDILSHHGVFVRPPGMRNYFPAALEPPVLFERGRALVGESWSTRVVDEPFYRFLVLFQQICVHEAYQCRLARPRGRLWKNVVADALMLPCVVLQAVDDFVYKRDSFPRFYERYADLDLSVIREAEAYRLEWGRQRNLYRWLDGPGGPWMRKLAYRFALAFADRWYPTPPAATCADFNDRVLGVYRDVLSQEGWVG